MVNIARFLTLVSMSLIFLLTDSTAQDLDQPGEPPAALGVPMTLDRIDELVRRIDADAIRNGNSWQINYRDMPIYVIGDDNADRIRIMSPVSNAAILSEGQLVRLMQANFETALDARYAIAQGAVWSAFIHPLSVLSEREFFSGMGQTMSLVVTYGTTFSSGALAFTGGDYYDEDENPDEPDVFGDIMEKGEQI
ncbi:MAG: hypothetical protein E2O64_02750 [Gammaproteobacteria bacterium]|nr:MAG: hypothetical protein E2O64_02750 [Gammaproteobacteria bacterium]